MFRGTLNLPFFVFWARELGTWEGQTSIKYGTPGTLSLAKHYIYCHNVTGFYQTSRRRCVCSSYAILISACTGHLRAQAQKFGAILFLILDPGLLIIFVFRFPMNRPFFEFWSLGLSPWADQTSLTWTTGTLPPANH